MARKKAEKGILINGLDINHIVEKSRPLVLMRAVEFSLGELKILDTYLSRINSRNSESRTVRFSKEEYEQLMDIQQARPEDLEKAVGAMMKHTVTIPLGDGEWKKYTLFSVSSFSQEKKTGQWWVELTCTEEAKKLFFNLENTPYLQYQLRNVISLTSKYSVFLYVYLLSNRFRKNWKVSVEYLKTNIFQCDKVISYNEYKEFNRLVLSKSIKEINEKTDIEFEFKTIRTGRIITDIEFNLVKENVFIPKLPEIPETPESTTPTEYHQEELDACHTMTDYKFSDSEIEMLLAIMRQNPYIQPDREHHSITFGRAEYLGAQYAYMLAYDTPKKPIKHKFKYLLGAVQDNYAQVMY
jgi:hypothetical protein